MSAEDIQQNAEFIAPGEKTGDVQRPLQNDKGITYSDGQLSYSQLALLNVGVREVLGIGYGDSDRVSYAESAAICQTLIPELYTDDKTFSKSPMSEDILLALYEQRAKAQSQIRNENVTALMLSDEDIITKDKEIAANREGKALKTERKKLFHIRQRLKNESYNERQVLERDVYQVRRDLPISGMGKGYMEFRLPHQRSLRIRLFHPDKPEHVTGVDVVYEHLWDEEELARIVAMQYKMLEKDILSMPFQKELERFQRQLNKMKNTFCDAAPLSYCHASDDYKTERWYCPHYCSVFLRPTDRPQKADLRYASSGYHIPVCRFRDLWDASTSKRLPVQSFQRQSIKSECFEELFNLNELGSRWLNYSELEEFYKKNKVLEPDDRIVAHVQVYA
jgi:hypothetical protein